MWSGRIQADRTRQIVTRCSDKLHPSHSCRSTIALQDAHRLFLFRPCLLPFHPFSVWAACAHSKVRSLAGAPLDNLIYSIVYASITHVCGGEASPDRQEPEATSLPVREQSQERHSPPNHQRRLLGHSRHLLYRCSYCPSPIRSNT